MFRIALGIEYDGSTYHGWQHQANLATVQGHLEAALSKIAAEAIHVFCAGRTDAGVHASGQVVHFETQAIREMHTWTLGTNSLLPSGIAVTWAKAVAADFHARFSAEYRRYRYLIYCNSTRPAIFARKATWQHHMLDLQLMQAAADLFVGEKNFSSFRSTRCEAKTPVRHVHYVKVSQVGKFIAVEIQANAFLHHMVRNIIGVLLKVGRGLAPPEIVASILAAEDRRSAFETAPADGLYLMAVGYPAKFALPDGDKNSAMLDQGFALVGY